MDVKNRGMYISKYFEFLSLLGSSARWWTLGELAEKFKRDQRSMRRWLYAAEEHHLVERSSNLEHVLSARQRGSGNIVTVWQSRFILMRRQ